MEFQMTVEKKKFSNKNHSKRTDFCVSKFSLQYLMDSGYSMIGWLKMMIKRRWKRCQEEHKLKTFLIDSWILYSIWIHISNDHLLSSSLIFKSVDCIIQPSNTLSTSFFCLSSTCCSSSSSSYHLSVYDDHSTHFMVITIIIILFECHHHRSHHQNHHKTSPHKSSTLSVLRMYFGWSKEFQIFLRERESFGWVTPWIGYRSAGLWNSWAPLSAYCEQPNFFRLYFSIQFSWDLIGFD